MSLNIVAEENELNKEGQEYEEHEENVEEEEVSTPDEEVNTDNDEPEVEIPEKFKNASREDIVKSYRELEKTLGERSQEIGELRKLADNFLKQELESRSRTAEQEPEESKEVSFDDFVEDPNRAVKEATKDEFEKIKEDLNSMKREKALVEFQSRHPDYQDVGQDPEFIEWVKKSPYRAKRFESANYHYDFDAADELLSEFKERREILKQDQKEAKQKVEKNREEELKKASVESGGNREKSSKKVFRKADLIRMRIEDPEQFDARSDEIQAAYAEGRVK